MTTAEYTRTRRLRAAWNPMWGHTPPPVDCAHVTPWRVVCRYELDRPSRWLGGGRYLREVCPWCNQWVSTRPVPKVAA